MSQPNINVVIPSYNHAMFIKHTLDSIYKQKVAPNKLIVIDDGSTDNSIQVIEKSLKKCPFACELIVRNNRGISATLNEGLAKTDGEYFAYLSSDDIWLPDFLSRRLQILEAKPDTVLCFGHAYLIDEQQQITDCTKKWTSYQGDILQLLLRGIIPLSPSVVYRRKTLEKYGWNEKSILEDYELYLKLSSEGEFAVDDEVLCAWRQHQTNVSKDVSLMLKEWIEAQNRVAQNINIDSEALKEIQRELKLNSAKDLIRVGKKREAIKLMAENTKNIKSISKVGEILLRLVIPNRIFQWNRKRKINKSIKTFGKLEI